MTKYYTSDLVWLPKAAPRGELGGRTTPLPPISHRGQFSNSSKSGEKGEGRYGRGIKSRDTDLVKFHKLVVLNRD